MNHRNENGAALITSLVFLTILTLLGVTSMQSSTLQEKMAGNLQLSNQSFGYAEVGLSNSLQSYQGDGSITLNKTLSDIDACHPRSGLTTNSTSGAENAFETCAWFLAESKAQVNASSQATSAKEGSQIVNLVFSMNGQGQAKGGANTVLSQSRLQRGAYRKGLAAN